MTQGAATAAATSTCVAVSATQETAPQPHRSRANTTTSFFMGHLRPDCRHGRAEESTP